MPLFAYRGRDAAGAAVAGTVEAANLDGAVEQLFGQGVVPLEVRERASASPSLEDWFKKVNAPKIKLLDLVFFARQMHTLLRASVPLIDALRGLERSSRNPSLKDVLNAVVKDLEAGTDFTAALKKHPKVFSALFVSMVHVGETTGNLPEVFAELAKYMQQEKETRERVSTAMRYPLFVMVAILVALIVISVWVIPVFERMFAKFGADLPIMTKILIGLSNIVVHHWHPLLGGAAGVAYAARSYLKTARGRFHWDKYKLRLPLVGSILFRSLLARFTKALAITAKAGVPMVQGLPIAAAAIDNAFVEGRVQRMREGLEQGDSVTQSAVRAAMFPDLVVQMIEVGEDSGSIDEMIGEVSEFYEREVEYDVKGLSSAIEPVLIGVIGLMVMVLALGVFVPMWGMMEAAKGR